MDPVPDPILPEKKIIKIMIITILIKVKVSPLHAMKAHRGSGCKDPHIYSDGTRKRKGGLILCSAPFTPNTSTHFIGG